MFKPFRCGRACLAAAWLGAAGAGWGGTDDMHPIKLPEPKIEGRMVLEKTLYLRRSVREFKNDPLLLNELAMLLWAAQGVTAVGGFRTTPSAGALYPLELYVVVGLVRDLAPGVYHYKPGEHALAKLHDHDVRRELGEASLEQTWMQGAAAMLVITAVPERTTRKYGARGHRYVLMEAGHAAQNVALQAVALDLGSVAVGAFDDQKVRHILKLKPAEEPLYILPVGRQ